MTPAFRPVFRRAALALVSALIVASVAGAMPPFAAAAQGTTTEKKSFMGNLLNRAPASGMQGTTVTPPNLTTSRKLDAVSPAMTQAQYDKAFVDNLNKNQASRNKRVETMRAEYTKTLAADQEAARAGNAAARTQMTQYYAAMNQNAAAGVHVPGASTVPGATSAQPASTAPVVRRPYVAPKKADDNKPVRLFNTRDRTKPAQ